MDAPGGFEPPLTDSESVVLPLHYGAMVEVEGIEPPTSGSKPEMLPLHHTSMAPPTGLAPALFPP